jgi:hypothetical protein
VEGQEALYPQHANGGYDRFSQPQEIREMADIGAPIGQAQQDIARRNAHRQHVQHDVRSPAALEIIADEMTMMRAEMTVIRSLLAQFVAKP